MTDQSVTGAESLAAPPARPATQVKAAPRSAAAQGRRRLLLVMTALVTLASLFGPIAASGIWDPHELRVADLARRIALTLLGGSDLALEGSTNTVPTLGELARGQLPFTSVALGFRLFGLHEWAGRLPLALWGLVGIAASYALVARLADRVAAAFSALALATMPLYFLHARTILGDIVTMAGVALAVSGLGLAVFDSGADRRRATRIAWLVLGALGVAAAFGARGLMVGAAAPLLAVGLSWLVVRGRGADRFGELLGAGCLLLGVTALAFGMRALSIAEKNPVEYSMWVGAAVNPPRQLPTFDWVIHYLGHGTFPWSAFVPFAVGRVLRAPAGSDDVSRRGHALRVLVIVASATAFFAHGWIAPVTGLMPFSAVFALAVIAGVSLSDFEKGAPGSRAIAMGVCAFAILFYTDFKNFPEKGLSAFVVEGARFPESFKESATKLIKYSTLAFCALFFVSFGESAEHDRHRFRFDEYRQYFRTLRQQWNGNLWFTFVVLEAALCGYAVLAWLSERHFHWKQFEGMSPVARQVAAYGWVGLPVLVLLAPPLALLGRDAARWAFSKLPTSRAVVTLASLVAFGCVLSLRYYPALAAQISPREVFDSYRRLAAEGERLALLGVGAGSASYYAGRDVPTFDNPISAFEWLMTGEPGERRWLVVREKELAQLNSMYRGRVTPVRNLPVLDARSSEIVLVSDELRPGEENQNPYARWVLDAPPNPTRKTNAAFGSQLENVGWDVTTEDGKPVDSVVPGKDYHFRIYYKVLKPISGNWETFIHIDGFSRRYNGDHKTLEGKYPFHLWKVGDHIVDVHPFRLEPNFTPGDYSVYYGLFIGNRRLEVTRGRHHENRLEAGRLPVR